MSSVGSCTRTPRRASLTTWLVDAYVVEIPLKSANSILKCVQVYCISPRIWTDNRVQSLLQNTIPNKDDVDLQHLRRFAKPVFLPGHLRLEASSTSDLDVTQFDGQAGKPALTLHLLVCAASLVPLAAIETIFNSSTPFEEAGLIPHIFTIPVPLYPPTSEEQANKWSELYWPTVYKRSNPFGPHPSLVARAEEELRELAGKWMALAQLAAKQVTVEGLGQCVGAVIVDRGSGKEPSAVAVAGDARWCGPTGPSKAFEGSGNVIAHAVMRAIGMIARKRLRVSETGITASKGMSNEESAVLEEDVFFDRPLTAVEQLYYDEDNLPPGGYLCLDLDIYITHEPCLMCSMAILHSRFGRAIFGQRMLKTGGLTAEGDAKLSPAQPTHKRSMTHDGGAVMPAPASEDLAGLGYGIFWRPELNWKLLAWQWKDTTLHWPNGFDEHIHI